MDNLGHVHELILFIKSKENIIDPAIVLLLELELGEERERLHKFKSLNRSSIVPQSFQ